MGRFEIVLDRLKIVVDRCGSLRVVMGSLWIIVGRCGSYSNVNLRAISNNIIIVDRPGSNNLGFAHL